jgi:hypothetical protein
MATMSRLLVNFAVEAPASHATKIGDTAHPSQNSAVIPVIRGGSTRAVPESRLAERLIANISAATSAALDFTLQVSHYDLRLTRRRD